MKITFAVLIVAFGMIGIACAQDTGSIDTKLEFQSTHPDLTGNDPHWLKDAEHGCWLFDSRPLRGETVSWSGACKNGLASGEGTATWYLFGVMIERRTGSFDNGSLSGHGTAVMADGSTFDGNWSYSVRYGRGTLTFSNRSTYDELWPLGDELPDKLANNTCEYPEAALRSKAEGNVLVSFVPMTDGTLQSVAVRQTSGNADLDKASVECVSHWQFNPMNRTDRQWTAFQGAYIYWYLSDWSDGRPIGRRIGLPHNCEYFYPRGAFLDHVTGTTTLRFRITDQGQVRDPEITQSSGSDALDTAALSCVRVWHYLPAVDKGKKVEAHGTAEIPWSIDGSMVVSEHFDK